MRIPKELYSDANKLREYCVREASLYLGMLLVIDKLNEERNILIPAKCIDCKKTQEERLNGACERCKFGKQFYKE